MFQFLYIACFSIFIFILSFHYLCFARNEISTDAESEPGYSQLHMMSQYSTVSSQPRVLTDNA